MSMETEERELRIALVRMGRSLFTRGLTAGSTGNLSVRIGDSVLSTPTGSRLGDLEPDALAEVSLWGEHISGPRATKEAFLHAAMYRARPSARAVVHLHSTHAAAVSCLDGIDEKAALPPLTAYYAMRVGRMPLLAYHAPGDPALGPLAEATAQGHHALLLANHGPIVAGASLDAAADAAEEIEETAKLYLLLHGHRTRPLTAEQAAHLSK
ncbi:3-oxo-tetronate 4-phosphate decarboxylase [Nocardiopsis synnemataformans]|uniref:3-oxo-tetronate 4-phosphate decarboxylase n=1 Tax=Nocardiopsis synnemataformans TaxID=61305 RepID=UPI003EBD86F8